MKALILVDIQNDFLPGGALAVPRGDEIIPLVNEIQKNYELIVATQDYHPAGHGSFASAHAGRQVYEVIDLNGLPQVLWPDHCVQGTAGAEFANALDMSRVAKVFHKGTDAGVDSYSGFFDNGKKIATGLGDYLKEKGVTEVHVCGLATDYCVKATALDALGLGFKTVLLEDASRGVNVNPGDVEKAVSEMKVAGVEILLFNVERL